MVNDLLTKYEHETGAFYKDSLTGLYTYGIFSMILDREVKRAERNDSTFSVALVDIDYFSIYNKKMGTVAASAIATLRQDAMEMFLLYCSTVHKMTVQG
jgi:diguanylate cyclase (GGDEF)-like protein